MNTIKKIQITLIALATLLAFNSCVKDDDWSIPPIQCETSWEANMTLAELFALVDSDGAIHSFDTDTYIEGYVISSDETGNFFKTVSIQDNSVNPTKGLQIEMDRPNLFSNYPAGSKIIVKLKGLKVGYDRGMLKVGDIFVDNNGNERVGRMAEHKINQHVAMTCDDMVDVEPVQFDNLDEMFASGIFNTLATIHNIQIDDSEVGNTFADAVNQTTVDRNLVDVNGTKVKLRNSGFADFAGELMPTGSGSITVVISGYDANNNGIVSPGEYQLMISSSSDLNFDQPRFGDGPGPGPEPGNYFSCLNENFESYSVDFENFPNYENLGTEGGRKWRVTEFGGNKYIQISAFNASGNVTSHFVVPVDFDKADTFSFKTNDGFNNGNPLKIYYSTDYVIGGNINNATLNNITSSFTISTGHSEGYGNGFVDSGEYSLSGLSGEGVIVFAYEGSGTGITTTIQIDDIKIIDNDDPDCGSDPGPDPGDGPEQPGENAAGLFGGYDFENWDAFTGGINQFGLKTYATQGAGEGLDGSASLHISTNPETTNGNDYVFTSFAAAGLPANPSKVNFYMRGTADKSVSLNVYKTDGSYYSFNLGSLTTSSVIQVAGNNQYSGSINTGGNWVLIELDLSGLSDLNMTNTSGDVFALKIGKNANYNLHFDNFTIE